MTAIQALAFGLLIADALLLLTTTYAGIKRASPHRPILTIYFFTVAVPYLLSQLNGDPFPRGWWVWYVAAGHVAIALETCFLSIPPGSERRWLLATAAIVGVATASLVAFGHSGTLTTYLSIYRILTTACMAAVGIGTLTAGYVWAYREWRRAAGPALIAAYFAIDVAVNALYRRTEWVYGFNRMLLGADHAGHLIVVGLAIWAAWPRSAATAASPAVTVSEPTSQGLL